MDLGSKVDFMTLDKTDSVRLGFFISNIRMVIPALA